MHFEDLDLYHGDHSARWACLFVERAPVVHAECCPIDLDEFLWMPKRLVQTAA